jgi:hypothetical protein
MLFLTIYVYSVIRNRLFYVIFSNKQYVKYALKLHAFPHLVVLCCSQNLNYEHEDFDATDNIQAYFFMLIKFTAKCVIDLIRHA